MATGSKTGRLYPLAAQAQKQVQKEVREGAHAATEVSNQMWDAWHRWMGHLAKSGLEKLVREDLVEGLTVDEVLPPLSQCDACVKAKMTTKPYLQEAKEQREDPGN